MPKKTDGNSMGGVRLRRVRKLIPRECFLKSQSDKSNSFRQLNNLLTGSQLGEYFKT